MTPLVVPEPIAGPLRLLRRRIASWVLLDGISRVLLGLIAFVLVDLLLDWSFHMDRAQRTVMLALATGGVGFIAYRRLWRPLVAQPTDDALCLEVERQHPRLRQSLISAVQFSRQPVASAGVSPAMVRATVELGVRGAGGVDFSTVLHRGRWRMNAFLLSLGVVAMVAMAASTLADDTFAIWFNRNVLLGDREWPQDVHFRIAGAADGVLTVPRGDDWPLEVIVTEESRRLPREVWLEVRSTRRRQRMETLEEGRRFQTDLINVTEPLEFRVVEDRASSDWTRIRLVDRPSFAEMELSVTPPEYTNAPPTLLPPDGGPYQVLAGSRLSIRGRSTKPLSAVTLTQGETRHEATLTGDTTFALDLSQDQLRDGEYLADLTDTEQLWLPGRDGLHPLTSRDPATFRLRTVPDHEPQVKAQLKGVGTRVTPRALIPIACEITDDYALTDIRLVHRWRGEGDESDVTATQSLNSLTQLPQRAADFEHVLDLEPFALPAGMSLSFVVEADDNNTVSGPGTGRSTVFLVRVVTAEELLAALYAREREQRGEFEKRIGRQDELWTECRALLADVRGAGDLDDDQRGQLAQLHKRQKAIGEDVARIARRLEDIVVEVRHNRLEEAGAALETRLSEQIIAPLWEIANGRKRGQTPDTSNASEDERGTNGSDPFSGDGVESVTAALERARLQAAVPTDRDALLAQAASAQEQLLARMREILIHMERAEGFQEAVNLLLEVQKAQQDVYQRTDEAKQEAIRRLLEGAAPQPD